MMLSSRQIELYLNLEDQAISNSVFSCNLVDTGIHALAFCVMPKVTTTKLDAVFDVFDCRTAAATGVIRGSETWVELNIV